MPGRSQGPVAEQTFHEEALRSCIYLIAHPDFVEPLVLSGGIFVSSVAGIYLVSSYCTALGPRLARHCVPGQLVHNHSAHSVTTQCLCCTKAQGKPPASWGRSSTAGPLGRTVAKLTNCPRPCPMQGTCRYLLDSVKPVEPVPCSLSAWVHTLQPSSSVHLVLRAWERRRCWVHRRLRRLPTTRLLADPNSQPTWYVL